MAADGQIVCKECGQTGGRFRHVSNGEYVHTPGCDHPQGVRDGAKNLYDFVTTHIAESGEPIRVHSARQLSALEKEHGVINRVHHYNEQNW